MRALTRAVAREWRVRTNARQVHQKEGDGIWNLSGCGGLGRRWSLEGK